MSKRRKHKSQFIQTIQNFLKKKIKAQSFPLGVNLKYFIYLKIKCFVTFKNHTYFTFQIYINLQAESGISISRD